jgi:hypothetical protein
MIRMVVEESFVCGALRISVPLHPYLETSENHGDGARVYHWNRQCPVPILEHTLYSGER